MGHIVLPKIVQNCSTWPTLARQKCSLFPEMTQTGYVKNCVKIAKKCSKSCVKVAQRFAQKYVQSCSKCKMSLQWANVASKRSDLYLHNLPYIYRCESLSLLGICCMPVSIVAWALRSMSIWSQGHACYYGSESFRTLNRQFQLTEGSLVIRLVAIVSINGYVPKKIALEVHRKEPFMPAFFFCLITAYLVDISWYQTWTSGIFWGFFEIWKVADLCGPLLYL